MSQKNSLYNADEYVSSVAMEISDAVDSLSEYEQIFAGFVSAYDYNRYLYSLDLTKIINTVATQSHKLLPLWENTLVKGVFSICSCHNGGDCVATMRDYTFSVRSLAGGRTFLI